MSQCNTLARWASCFLLAGILALAPGCGGSSDKKGGQTQAATPTFSAQPQTQTVLEGASATLSVTATASNGTLSYQWKKGITDLTGKTSASLTLNPVLLADAGIYTVAITNTLNGTTASATSSAAVLTVNPAPATPVIGTQPLAQTVLEGGSASLSVTATASNGTLTYQWKKGGVDLSGKTASSLTFNPAALADAGSYTVVVTNSLSGATASTTSAAAVLTVNALATAPIIGTQPIAQTVLVGGSATLGVAATGNGTLSYQWKKDATVLAGKISASLVLNSVSLADAGSYSVAITNTLNGTTASATSSAAQLTVNPAPATPIISTQPQAQTVLEGGSATLSVAATASNGTLSYQWKKGTTVLAGKISTSLVLNPVSLADAGSYSVVVTNSLSGATASATSSVAALTVNPIATAPIIGTQPLAQTVLEGGSATLSVAATGNGTLSYQWMKGTTVLAGQTSASLVLNPVSLADAGGYTVAITNTLNGTTASATSNAAALTVNPAPATPIIATQPQAQTVLEGGSATLSVTATASNGTLSYQWKKAGVDLSGQTTSTLTFNPVALTDAGSYTVVVTNTLSGTTASTTSGAAVLTVNAVGGPVITTQPQPATAVVPDTATFTVVANGTTPTYQWQKNGVDINLATGSSYTIPATTLQELSATYRVIVTAGGSSVTSDNALLTVTQPDPLYAGDPVAVPSRPLNLLEYVTTYSPRGAFRLGYDEGLMNALWSSSCTYSVAVPFTAQGVRDYRPDPRTTSRVADGDFSNTGYTRGHLTLMSDMELRYGGQAGTDSSFTTNLAPQVAAHNNNLWNSLEQEVTGAYNVGTLTWTKPGLVAATNRLWITTGPTFSATPARTAGNTNKGMAIPNGFYKIMVKEVAGKPKVLAVLTPHEPTPLYSTIADYVTSVERIETLAGLNLFPSLAGTPTETQQFRGTVDVLGWGAPFEQSGKPNVHMIEPSWDTTVSAGTTVTFTGAASSTTGTVSLPTWTFGAEGTATGMTTTHTFNLAGTVSVSFSVVDGSAVTNTITRVITVTSGNAAPTIGSIANKSAILTAPVNVPFSVNDDTTARNLLSITATSSNQAVLLDTGIVLTIPPDATTGIGALTLTGTGATGTATVTVRVTDGGSASVTTTFTFTVSDGNFAPVITGLSAQTTPVDTPLTVTFTVSDTETAAGSLTVTATSSDTTLVPGTLAITNTNGSCSLVLTPGSGLSGSATMTITVTDGGGKSISGTFGFTVGVSAAPKLIISQYYEGAGNNRWIEVTNVGTAPYDATATPMYLWLWANPYKNGTVWDSTNQSGTYGTFTLTGTLGAGQSWLFKNGSKALPEDANITGTAFTAASICTFKDDDIVFLSPVATGGPASYAARTDVIGVNAASWMGNNQLVAGGWALALGTDRSYVRKSTVVAPSPAFDINQWTQVDAAQINDANRSLVDTAPTGSTNRLGEHIYNH